MLTGDRGTRNGPPPILAKGLERAVQYGTGRTIHATSDKVENRRRRQGPSARRDHVRQLAEGTVSLGALCVLLVLFDRTGHGTHWSWCGRLHLGKAAGKMAGRARPYSVRQVGRFLLELTVAGWIVSRRRWNDTAVRRLSDKLLEALAKLAGKRWRGKRATEPARPVERCDECAMPSGWHVEDCSRRGPPAS